MSLMLKCLGHASLYIQAGAVKILCDPWLDTEMFGFCRRFPDPGPVQIDLPAPDFVFLSHHHWDHVQISTLLRFDPETRFLIPENPQLIRILTQLGFENFQVLDPWSELPIPDGKLVATQSHVPFGEIGLLVIHQEESLWNLVDTVIEDSDIERVRSCLELKELGICLAPYQSYDEMSVLMRKNSPQKDRVMETNAKILSQLETKLILPAADGLYYPGDKLMNSKSFLNHPFDFIDCIHQHKPEQKCMITLPFDEFHLMEGELRVQRTMTLSMEEVLSFYNDYRSFKPDMEFEKLEMQASPEQEELDELYSLFEEWLSCDWFSQYPQDVMDYFVKERVVWVLEILGAPQLFCVDFQSRTTSLCIEQVESNSRVRLSLQDFFDLLNGQMLLSILIQSSKIELRGSSHALAYRSLDVLWYAGFQDEQCLESYVESFL